MPVVEDGKGDQYRVLMTDEGVLIYPATVKVETPDDKPLARVEHTIK